MVMAAYSSTDKKKTAGVSFEELVKEIKAGQFKPVYYLMGDESFYIDRLSDLLVETLLRPEERDFNLLTFFGAETDIDAVITAAKAYPMGAQHLVILVKEAQNLQHLERLEFYFRQMQPSSVLIFCHKNGTVDQRLKVVKLIKEKGVLFESKKLYDSQLPAFIKNYLQSHGATAAPGAPEMLAEFVGADLQRLASELDKLILSLPQERKIVTPDLVTTHIGVSKNFNIFELQDAIGKKDVLKVNQIAKYFDNNPKENPIQKVLPSLFKFFSTLMLAYYAPEKSERGIAQWVGATEWQVRRNILPAMKMYSGVKVMYILSEIRRTDARSKGVGNTNTSNGDLMKELLYYILH